MVGKIAVCDARAGPGHRRRRRRSERDRDLFPGRRAVRLRAGLDDVPDHTVHDRHPDGQRPHRRRHRTGTGGEPGQGDARRAAARFGGALAHCQYAQHRRRHRGDGRCVAAGRRRPDVALHRGVRHRLPHRRDPDSVSLLFALPEGAHARAVRLCRHRFHHPDSVGRGGGGDVPAAGIVGSRLHADAGGDLRHHDQSLHVLLASLARSGGAQAARQNDEQLGCVHHQAPWTTRGLSHRARHHRRHVFVEHHRIFYHRHHCGHVARPRR